MNTANCEDTGIAVQAAAHQVFLLPSYEGPSRGVHAAPPGKRTPGQWFIRKVDLTFVTWKWFQTQNYYATIIFHLLVSLL